MSISRSVETSCMISDIGKSGARSSGPTGLSVPGCRTGGGGDGRSAIRLYQRFGNARFVEHVLDVLAHDGLPRLLTRQFRSPSAMSCSAGLSTVEWGIPRVEDGTNEESRLTARVPQRGDLPRAASPRGRKSRRTPPGPRLANTPLPYPPRLTARNGLHSLGSAHGFHAEGGT